MARDNHPSNITETRLERRLGDWARAKLPAGLVEFIMFGLKQGWACLFGGLLLIAIITSKLIWQQDWPLSRYDALFLFALVTQALFLWFNLESWDEAKVILIYHIVGTVMEVYKLNMGSWDYPDQGIAEIMGVPLFSGFMYASIGSYMARVIRLFDMRFAPYPPFWTSVVLALLIYGNFFTEHFLPDIRVLLFIATIALYWRTRIWFYIGHTPRWMPLPLAAFLTAFFIWIAENIGTFTATWTYPDQSLRDWVSFGKFGSWYLLLYVSFVLVTLVFRDALHREPLHPEKRNSP
ncbi:MAG: DUF817 domain-containing protein [Alphaproteobacteria bacterium]|nr:DUF817 domain-containing protein [Alphaproteobacteria bacterium]